MFGGDGSVPLDQGSHDSTSGFNSHGQRSDIKQQKIGNGLVLFTSKDGGLDSGTVGNSLIRVDGLVQFLAVEEIRDQLLDLGDTGGAAFLRVALFLVQTIGNSSSSGFC